MKKIPWITQSLISLIVIILLFKYFINDINDWSFVLISIIYIFLTLIKIPLIISIYYSQKILWRIIFLTFLVTLIIMEFMTISTTLEFYDPLQYQNIESTIITAGVLSLLSPIITFIVIFIKDKK